MERKCENCGKCTKLAYGLMFCKEKGFLVPADNKCEKYGKEVIKCENS